MHLCAGPSVSSVMERMLDELGPIGKPQGGAHSSAHGADARCFAVLRLTEVVSVS